MAITLSKGRIKKKINYFHGIFHRGGGETQSVKIFNFLKTKYGGKKNLKTLQTGLKHENKTINLFYHIMTPPTPTHKHTVGKIMEFSKGTPHPAK